MSWDRRLDLHIDVDAPFNRNLITSETDSSVLNSPPEIVSGDKFKLRLYFWRRGPVLGRVEAIDPGESSTFRLSGRPLGVPLGSPLLFLATAFTQEGTGIWETTVDLATAELRDHLAAPPVGAKNITCEVEIRDASDSSRRSLQFVLVALPQVWENQDAPSTLPDPAAWLFGTGSPTPDFTVDRAGGGAFSDGATSFLLPPFYKTGTQYGADTFGGGLIGEDQWVAQKVSPNIWLLSGGINKEWTAENDAEQIEDVDNWVASGTTVGLPVIARGVATLAPPYFRLDSGVMWTNHLGVWRMFTSVTGY